MVEIPNQGFRRVVPSPRPQTILEIDLIRRLPVGLSIITVVKGVF
jgi:carbamate kinase